MKITFDSNVWRIVASPYSFPKESEIASFKRINEAVATGKLEASPAETVFTLEAIKKSDRQQFLATDKPTILFEQEETDLPDRNLLVSMGPDTNSHPGNNHYLNKRRCVHHASATCQQAIT